jgi:hypothetical protein
VAQLGPAHRAWQVHLQEASLGQRLDHRCRDAAQRFAFIALSQNLRDQASGHIDNIGFGPGRSGRWRDVTTHDAAWRSAGEPFGHDGTLGRLIQSRYVGEDSDARLIPAVAQRVGAALMATREQLKDSPLIGTRRMRSRP